MVQFHLIALIALGAMSAETQPAPAPVPIQPSPDSPAQRQKLRTLTNCLAVARPRWARQTLAQPYLSDAQAGHAAEVLQGRDNCMLEPEDEYTFRTSSLVGSLAEHFVRAEIGRTNPNRLSAALSTLTPLNVSEDFALCVAARNPSAARDLTLSDPGSPAELQAASQVGAHLGQCTNPGEDLTVDLQSLRALVATALYRGINRARN